MTEDPGAPDENGKTDIALGGSTSLTDTMTKLVNAYMELYPYMNLTVGVGGSGAGETGADQGSLDIGMLSRDMGSEYEGNLVPLNIGRDGVAVVANIDGVDELTMEQVAAIFSGEITNWSEVGGPDENIRVVIRDSASGTRECFETAMEKVDSEWTVTANATSYNSTGGVIGQIQTLYGSIGYISIGRISELTDTTDQVASPHAIEIDGVIASEDNVVNGSYQIQRNLVLVTKGDFLNWITCPVGQAILAEEFVPLSEDQMTEDPGAPDQNGETHIALGGSTSLTDTMTKLVNAYMDLYPYMDLTVGVGGSGAGETGADQGSLDIGMLSRDMGSEYEGNLVPLNIGRDGVAVVANIAGVHELTMEQIAAIFSGEITNWSEVGGPDEAIRVIIRDSASGTRECFETAMENVDPEWTVTTNATSYNSTGGVIGQINTLEGSIGYISIGRLAELGA